MRHGIRVVGRVEFQPGALGILFQYSLALQAAAYRLTNEVDPIPDTVNQPL
jgi:hypothetical protein